MLRAFEGAAPMPRRTASEEPSMSEKTAKILKFHADRCKGCRDCERACSQVHFKTDEGGERSAIRILEKGGAYEMQVCNHCGLCIDLCPVGALERKAVGTVLLAKAQCVGCQACVGFCPTGVMRRASILLTPFKCISCGSCAKACPEQALELVKVDLDEIRQVVFHAYHE
jgi:Fe-S-cluster-containing hydrogenase component 2